MHKLSDFLPSYPPTNDPYFSSKISILEEFAELRATPHEQNRVEGLYPHQILVARLMQVIDKLLIIDAPGTGKSCSLYAIAELCMEMKANEKLFLHDYVPPTEVIVLIPNQALEMNLLEQLVFKCSSGKYLTEEVLNARTFEEKKYAMKAVMKERVNIMTYYQFTKKMLEFKLESDLDAYLVNKIILCDEIHNIYRSKDVRLRDPLDPEEDDPSISSQKYSVCHKVFHRGKNLKVVGFTGTPMKSSIEEIPFILNPFLPLDNQMPYFTEAQLSTMTYEDLSKYMTGYISYIRAPDNGIDIEAVGYELEGYEGKLDLCPMSDFQYEQYMKVINQGDAPKDRAFFNRETKICQMVYPDGSFGRKGARKYMEMTKRNYTYKTDKDGQTLRSYYRDKQLLAEISCKSVAVLDILENAYADPSIYPDFQVPEDKGIVFVFFSDFIWGSGAMDYVAQMEEQGYEIFRDVRPVVEDIIGQDQNGQYVHRMRIPKKKRIALITGQTTATELQAIITLAQSYENRYGQYLQGIFGSQVTKEGLNFFNAVAMVKVGSSWYSSVDYQAMYRVIRADSHIHRLRELKEQKGPDARFKIRIHNLAAYYPGGKYPMDLQTIDVQKFFKLNIEQQSSGRIMKMLKTSSITCMLNKDRNVRPYDKDGSMVCDYQTCGYDCYGQNDKINKIDNRGKMLYYNRIEVDTMIDLLKALFSKNDGFMNLSDVINLTKMDEIYVIMAVNKMITEQIFVRDRYGQMGQLRLSDQDVLYISRSDHHPDVSIYESNLNYTFDPQDNRCGSFYFNKILYSADRTIFTIKYDKEWIRRLKLQHIIVQVYLFEQLWLGVNFQDLKAVYQNNFYRFLTKKYEGQFFILPEPIGKINNMDQILLGRGKGRGRKPKDENIKVRTRFLRRRNMELNTESNDQEGEYVIIHKLIPNPSISYQSTQEYLYLKNRLRILRFREQQWRDATQAEYIVYSEIIKENVNEYQSFFETYPFYGIMIEDKLFIKDADDPNDVGADRTKLNKGVSCDKSMPKEKLIEYLWSLGVDAPYLDEQPDEQVMRDLVRQRKFPQSDKLDLEKLTYVYSWYINKIKRRDICPILLETFRDKNMLFDGTKPPDYDTLINMTEEERREYQPFYQTYRK